MITIAAEHFALTPAIRSHVELNLNRLIELLPSDTTLRVFLSEPAPKKFRALCTAHVWGRDVVASEDNANLYRAIEDLRVNLTRKIVDEKDRWVRSRRHHGADAFAEAP